MAAFGRVWNRKTKFHPDHIQRLCPDCGAIKGSLCRNKNGVALLNQSHAARSARQKRPHVR